MFSFTCFVDLFIASNTFHIRPGPALALCFEISYSLKIGFPTGKTFETESFIRFRYSIILNVISFLNNASLDNNNSLNRF